MNSLSHVLFRPHLENHIHPGPPGKDKDGEKEKKNNQKISSRAWGCSKKERRLPWERLGGTDFT